MKVNKRQLGIGEYQAGEGESKRKLNGQKLSSGINDVHFKTYFLVVIGHAVCLKPTAL